MLLAVPAIIFTAASISFELRSGSFAFAISSISAYFGYYTKGGALAVGKASTKAVVYSSVVVLIINFIVTQLMLS